MLNGDNSDVPPQPVLPVVAKPDTEVVQVVATPSGSGDVTPGGRGGQTFPKSMEIRNSVAFRAVFFVFFHPNFSVVAESVSEQLLQRTGGLGGQFWLSKESVSTSATDCRIPTPICTRYGLQKIRTCRIDGLYL